MGDLRFDRGPLKTVCLSKCKKSFTQNFQFDCLRYMNTQLAFLTDQNQLAGQVAILNYYFVPLIESYCFFLNCSLIYIVLFWFFFYSGSFQWTQKLLVLHKVHYQSGRPVSGQWFKWQSHVHLEGTVSNYEIEICFMFAILSGNYAYF